jgi:hypothetical protein
MNKDQGAAVCVCSASCFSERLANISSNKQVFDHSGQQCLTDHKTLPNLNQQRPTAVKRVIHFVYVEDRNQLRVINTRIIHQRRGKMQDEYENALRGERWCVGEYGRLPVHNKMF